MANWQYVEIDFQQIYGIDMDEPGFRTSRSWRWLVLRILGLLSTEGRLQRVLRPIEQPKQ